MLDYDLPVIRPEDDGWVEVEYVPLLTNPHEMGYRFNEIKDTRSEDYGTIQNSSQWDDLYFKAVNIVHETLKLCKGDIVHATVALEITTGHHEKIEVRLNADHYRSYGKARANVTIDSELQNI